MARKVLPNVFVDSVKVGAARLGRDAGRIDEEVIRHPSTLPGSEVGVRVEIQVRVPGEVSEEVVRTGTENRETLKFESYGFGKE